MKFNALERLVKRPKRGVKLEILGLRKEEYNARLKEIPPRVVFQPTSPENPSPTPRLCLLTKCPCAQESSIYKQMKFNALERLVKRHKRGVKLEILGLRKEEYNARQKAAKNPLQELPWSGLK